MGSKTGLKVELSGKNGNVFNLIAICRNALKDNRDLVTEKLGKDINTLIEDFTNEVYKSKSYDEALCVMSDWFDVY